MKIIRRLFGSIFTVLFLLTVLACEKEEEEIPTYTIQFYDIHNEIYSTQQVQQLEEIQYPSFNIEIVDGYSYQFQGWDLNQDGSIDILQTLDSSLNFYPLFEKMDRYTINYMNQRLEVTSQTNFKLNPPTDTSLYFLGYYDENNIPVTDSNGNKLYSYKVEDNLTLTPKYLEKDEIIYWLELPQTVVSEQESLILDAAIEEGMIAPIDDESENRFLSENTFIYQGVKYERAVATTTKNNIFHNYTHVEKDETYYFYYEPVQFKVLQSDYDANYFEILTTQLVGACDFFVVDTMYSFWGDHYMRLKSEDNPFLESSLQENATIVQDTSIYFQGPYQGPALNNFVPEPELMTSTLTATDYILATTNIEVCYEKDYFFSAPYALNYLDSPISVSTNVRIRNVYGALEDVNIYNKTYGQVCIYKFNLKGEE